MYSLVNTIPIPAFLGEIYTALYTALEVSGDAECDTPKTIAHSKVSSDIPSHTPVVPDNSSKRPPSKPPKNTPINCDEAKTPIAVPRDDYDDDGRRGRGRGRGRGRAQVRGAHRDGRAATGEVWVGAWM